jgi:hypothetical protein
MRRCMSSPDTWGRCGTDDAGHDDAGHDDAGHDDAGHDDAGHDEIGKAWTERRGQTGSSLNNYLLAYRGTLCIKAGECPRLSV